MQGKILAVIDPTTTRQPALSRAARLAEAFGASLELFLCDYDQYLAGGRMFDSDTIEKGRQGVLDRDRERLEALAAPLAEKGLSVGIDVRWDHPLGRGIARKAVDARPMLVAKDTHYHPLLKRTIVSNTDWSLIRSCPVPLLLVKAREIASEPIVLAAVDPTHEHDKPAELDRAILGLAKELCTAVHGRLHVLHSYDTAPAIAAASDAPMPTMSVPVQELSAGVERLHREALDRLLEQFPVAAGNVHFEEGVAHESLVRKAEELGADFVVMGAVSRSALKRIFLGSTAERVLDRLPCDLIVVKPVGFGGPAMLP